MWQDWVISIANLLLIYSIIPQVYQGFKRKKGFLYYVDGAGNVCEAKMARGGKRKKKKAAAKKAPAKRKVAKRKPAKKKGR